MHGKAEDADAPKIAEGVQGAGERLGAARLAQRS
jgi:hypothetical protein